jgi:hypothetical protein
MKVRTKACCESYKDAMRHDFRSSKLRLITVAARFVLLFEIMLTKLYSRLLACRVTPTVNTVSCLCPLAKSSCLGCLVTGFRRFSEVCMIRINENDLAISIYHDPMPICAL